MIRQAHHERNQYITVRGEPVEGLDQSFLNSQGRDHSSDHPAPIYQEYLSLIVRGAR